MKPFSLELAATPKIECNPLGYTWSEETATGIPWSIGWETAVAGFTISARRRSGAESLFQNLCQM